MTDIIEQCIQCKGDTIIQLDWDDVAYGLCRRCEDYLGNGDTRTMNEPDPEQINIFEILEQYYLTEG